MSNEADKTPPKRKRGEDPHVCEVERDPDELPRKLADIAEERLTESERRIEDGGHGARAVALHGIGYALCSIAHSLSAIGEVAEEIDALREAPEHTDEEIARAFGGPVCADGACRDSAIEGCYYCAEHMPDGTVEVEIAVAVVCIDCQKAQGHVAGYCGTAGCLVCTGAVEIDASGHSRRTCVCCDGELVLEEPRPQAYPCSDDAAGVWCATHCPARVRRESDIAAPTVACSGGVTRCSEHCP